MTSYLGVEESLYVRAVGRAVLISAVARVTVPGCKVDHVLVAEGPQGCGKSSAARIIGGDWFSDDLPDLGSKDAALAANAAWIVEIAELDAMSRSEVSKIKAFISRSVDRIRPPYGKRIVAMPRQSIFIGTVNESAYLKDASGNRRFWPVRCGQIDLVGLAAARDQLFAEALVAFKNGERWHLTGEIARLAAEEQAERMQLDPWESPVLKYIEHREMVGTEEILLEALDIAKGKWSRTDQARVAAILTASGWELHRPREVKGRPRLYRRKLRPDER